METKRVDDGSRVPTRFVRVLLQDVVFETRNNDNTGVSHRSTKKHTQTELPPVAKHKHRDTTTTHTRTTATTSSIIGTSADRLPLLTQSAPPSSSSSTSSSSLHSLHSSQSSQSSPSLRSSSVFESVQREDDRLSNPESCDSSSSCDSFYSCVDPLDVRLERLSVQIVELRDLVEKKLFDLIDSAPVFSLASLDELGCPVDNPAAAQGRGDEGAQT